MIGAIPTGFFDAVSPAPLDPITGLYELWRSDPDPQKVNLAAGVFQDRLGQTPVLDVVKQVERELLVGERTKSYLAVSGSPLFRQLTTELVLGEVAGRADAIQVPGGTSAARLAAEFLRDQLPTASAWISKPAYPNHPGVFRRAGFPIRDYRYDCDESGRVHLERMLDDLGRASPGDVVLLHGCCHNPTGVELGVDQWKELAEVVAGRRLLPVIDLAYLGFGRGLDEDRLGLRTLVADLPEAVVLVSHSKNFGLYAERVGAVLFVGPVQSVAAKCVSRACMNARVTWSSPPCHGSKVVEAVLHDPVLKDQWLVELAAMRDRLLSLRAGFAAGLHERQIDRSAFPGLAEGCGMFTLSRLSASDAVALRDQHHIYMSENGRIALSGLQEATMEHVCAAIAGRLNTGSAASY